MTQPTKPVQAEQDAVARATKALRSAEEGVGLITAQEFLEGMNQRAQAAQQRIRAARLIRKSAGPGEGPVSAHADNGSDP